MQTSTTDIRLDDAAVILRAILDVPAERRLDALATALRAAMDRGLLSGDGSSWDSEELLRRATTPRRPFTLPDAPKST